MPAGEEKDCQWRGYSFRHDVAGLRELRRGVEDLPSTLQRGEHSTPYITLLPLHIYCSLQDVSHTCRLSKTKQKGAFTELFTDWRLETLLATQKQPAPSAGGANTGAATGGAGPYADANDGLLGGNGLDDSYDPAFAGAVHNGNGTADGY